MNRKMALRDPRSYHGLQGRQCTRLNKHVHLRHQCKTNKLNAKQISHSSKSSWEQTLVVASALLPPEGVPSRNDGAVNCAVGPQDLRVDIPGRHSARLARRMDRDIGWTQNAKLKPLPARVEGTCVGLSHRPRRANPSKHAAHRPEQPDRLRFHGQSRQHAANTHWGQQLVRRQKARP